MQVKWYWHEWYRVCKMNKHAIYECKIGKYKINKYGRSKYRHLITFRKSYWYYEVNIK